MITEDYISFETAKLLKEKGFNEECCAFYVKSKECGIELFHAKDSYNYNNNDNPCISAPTLQMIMKWLREIHNLSIEPYYDIILNWVVDIKHIGKHTDIKEFEHVRNNNYDSYEKACGAAIKYCLENLI